tara:strand:+ start:3247 stop:3423 length:177 start_codon:yes stop_codon:yes gene_type:complete
MSRCHRSPPPHSSTVLKKQNDFNILKIVIKNKKNNQENKGTICFLVNLGNEILKTDFL